MLKEYYSTKELIRKITGYVNGDIVNCDENEGRYVYNSSLDTTDDNDITLKPHDTQIGRWIKQEIDSLVNNVTALPTPVAALRGLVYLLKGLDPVAADPAADPPILEVVETADTLHVCYKKDDGTYAFKEINENVTVTNNNTTIQLTNVTQVDVLPSPIESLRGKLYLAKGLPYIVADENAEPPVLEQLATEDTLFICVKDDSDSYVFEQFNFSQPG